LAQVPVDQIRLAPRHSSYLPLSDDPALRVVLEALQREPGDRRSLRPRLGFIAMFPPTDRHHAGADAQGRPAPRPGGGV